MPSQKTGMDIPESEIIITSQSNTVLRKVAASTPAEIPTITAISMLAIASLIVAGNRSRIISATGRF